MYRYYITRDPVDGVLKFPAVPTPTDIYNYGPTGIEFDYGLGHFWGFVEYDEALPASVIAEYGLVPGISPKYYPIDENLARRAHEMMSFRDYKEGSKTRQYRLQVDEASLVAARRKKRTDLMYHEKIDSLLDTYARRLAENMNKASRIGTMCPSVMISGGSNFPIRKKEKQNAAADRNMAEHQEIMGIIDRIRKVGTGGISSDDPNALDKLRAKLANLEESQQTMKAANAYYRKNGTLDGFTGLSEDMIQTIKADMATTWHLKDKPFASYVLANNSANIRRIRERIVELEKSQSDPVPEGWDFDGGRVDINTELNRVQIRFDEKPGADLRAEMKASSFRWAPSQGAWQRRLSDRAIDAAQKITGRGEA